MGRERIGESHVKRLYTAEETQSFAASFAPNLQPNSILALQGNLGAGKTTFVQGLASAFDIADIPQSPTFTFLHIYHGTIPIYHFDLYRLKSERDFVLLGFEEFLSCGGIAIIEWPERIASLIPPEAWLIRLETAEGGRTASIDHWGNREV